MAVAARPGLTPDQRRCFDARGLVKLPGAVSRRAAEQMAERLWAELSRKHRIRRDAPATWRTERPADFRALQETGAFAAMASPAVCAALDETMGRGRWSPPPNWGQALVCFPDRRSPWRLPAKHWHIDLPVDPPGGAALTGRVFVLIAPLQPQGGGTLVVTGSHRLVQQLAAREGGQLSSGETRRRLKAAHPWFAALMTEGEAHETLAEAWDAPAHAAGVELAIEEMTGEPGDVFLMHQNALHAPSPNVRAWPRLALSQFVSPMAA